MRAPPILLCLALLAACTTPSRTPPVPAPLADTVPLPPVTPDPMIWQPGHWDWTGSGFTWTNGGWILTETAGKHYVLGYWDKDGNWVAPHWVR